MDWPVNMSKPIPWESVIKQVDDGATALLQLGDQTGGWQSCSKCSVQGRSERNPNGLAFFLHLPGLRETMISLKGLDVFRWIIDYSMFFFCAEGILRRWDDCE